MSKFKDTPAWRYQGNPVTEPINYSVGFVYQITNTVTGQHYIGKKLFWTKRNTQSDWKTYWGSNARLHADILLHKEHQFTRTILHPCSTRTEMSYHEARLQLANNVLHSDLYYNDCIILKINRRQIGKTPWNTSI